ncbi:hypothetical protein RCH06_000905 [Polaromonas sp. CG_9.5]|uniref:hypothetical protein n=1 Tax=Polaromonas sp. CG_9.5 TaxID=3071705 RepID=UPI002E022449|nr:hypothetical protein [Polaromonas sp. CG_9.5]
MNKFGLIDFRDEFYVKLFRRWLVISLLTKNTKLKDRVSIGKAAFVDFLLCNPTVQQKFLASFGKAQLVLNIDDFLYQDNIEFGSLQDVADFSKTCSLLIKNKYASFARIDGELVLQCLISPTIDDIGLTQRWRLEIKQVLPLMGKSLNVLHNSILKVSNGN